MSRVKTRSTQLQNHLGTARNAAIMQLFKKITYKLQFSRKLHNVTTYDIRRVILRKTIDLDGDIVRHSTI